MPVQSFNHYNLRASQPLLNQLKDFYVEVLGMSIGRRPPFSFPGYWLYLGDQPVLHLVEAQSNENVQNSSPGTLDHVAFTCTGLEEFKKRLQELGIKYRAASVPGTSQVQLFVHDPSGNGVEFNFATGAA